MFIKCQILSVASWKSQVHVQMFDIDINEIIYTRVTKNLVCEGTCIYINYEQYLYNHHNLNLRPQTIIS